MVSSPASSLTRVLAALALLGGCSAAQTGTPAPSAPVTTSASPAASAEYAERQQAVIAVPNADGLVAAAGAVWIKTDDGRVVRIDPTTNRVTGRITVDTASDDSEYCLGIGTDGTSVWTCAAGDDGTGLAQIDPKTLRVVRRVPIGKVFDQLAVPATSHGIWVLTAGGSSVSVVEPATGRVSTYPLGARCLQLTAQADRVVATCAQANSVIAVDAATGAVAGRLSLPAPRVVALTEKDLWVDTRDGLTRLTRDLVVRTVYQNLGAGLSGDLVAADGSVWMRTGDGTITKVDPATGQVAERVTPDRPLTAGSLLVAFGSIWTTSSDEGTVTRLRL